MKETVTIELRPDQRLVLRVKIPTTDEERRNSRKLTNTGAEKLLFDLRDNHVLYQRKNIIGSVIQFDPAVVNVGKDFRSVIIYFDGASSTMGKDGGFIKAGLCENEDQLSLNSKIGNNLETSKLISNTDLENEVHKVLITRETSLNFESREIKHKQ